MGTLACPTWVGMEESEWHNGELGAVFRSDETSFNSRRSLSYTSQFIAPTARV